MSKRIGICLTLILTLILAPAACQARYLNPNTGRFWPVDSFEGHNHDPQSLHKYLYSRANPINMVGKWIFAGWTYWRSVRSRDRVNLTTVGRQQAGNYQSYLFS